MNRNQNNNGDGFYSTLTDFNDWAALNLGGVRDGVTPVPGKQVISCNRPTTKQSVNLAP